MNNPFCAIHQLFALLRVNTGWCGKVVFVTQFCCNGRALDRVTKSINQTGKIFQNKIPKLCFQPLRTISGHFADYFRHFFGHFVDIPFFWAVQRLACYNSFEFLTLCLSKAFQNNSREQGRGAEDHLATFSFPGVFQSMVKNSTWVKCPQVLAGTARKVAKSTRFCSYAEGPFTIALRHGILFIRQVPQRTRSMPKGPCCTKNTTT